jgi:hypothetical protein
VRAQRRPKFVRRAGLALMAGLAISAKRAPDVEFMAERQPGAAADRERNPKLREKAIRVAEEIQRIDSPAPDGSRAMPCGN